MRRRLLAFLVPLIIFGFLIGVAFSCSKVQAYRLLEYGLSKDWDEKSLRPVEPTFTFKTSDKQALLWLRIDVTSEDLPFTELASKWYRPDGSLYDIFGWESVMKPSRWYFWNSIRISGREAAERLGLWLVEVYLKDKLLLSEHFTIGKYCTRVSVSGLPESLSTHLLIDGTDVGTVSVVKPLSISLEFGRSYTIAVQQYVSPKENIRYACASYSWSFSTQPDHLIEQQMHSFNYTAQYYLMVNSAYGEARGDGWYDAGSTAVFSVHLDTWSSGSLGYFMRYRFLGWGGDSDDTSPSATIVMNSPKTVIAIWQADYAMLLGLVSVLGAVSAVAVFALLRRRKQGKDTSKVRVVPHHKCIACGAVLLPDADFCHECGTKQLRH